MITKELIDRINQLARKSRSTALSPDEKEEQSKLREQYLQGIRQQVRDSLQQVKPDHPHSDSCQCGCNSKSIH